MKPTDALLYRRVLTEICEERPEAPLLDNSESMEGLRLWLPDSEVYYVSADMTAVARAAARGMPRQTLERDDAPAPSGFLVWDQPMTFADVDEYAFPIKGVAWSECLGVGCDDVPGVDVFVLADLAPLGGPSALLPVSWMPWPFGDEASNSTNLDYREDIVAAILATWTLMQQSLTVSTRTPAERPERRRWTRRGKVPPEIVIVRLRRVQAEGERDAVESTVEWTHRWLVGGHWRNQWLPSKGKHRLQWISPYVKGPAALPLIVKERVTAWTR